MKLEPGDLVKMSSETIPLALFEAFQNKAGKVIQVSDVGLCLVEFKLRNKTRTTAWLQNAQLKRVGRVPATGV